MLTEIGCRNFKPGEKAYKKFDGHGLYLLINPNGSKYWQYKYTFAGKNKVGSFGVYPEVSLKAARLKRDEYRRLLNENKDPTLLKKQQKLQLQPVCLMILQPEIRVVISLICFNMYGNADLKKKPLKC